MTVSSGSTTDTLNYSYDALQRLTSQTTVRTGLTLAKEYSYKNLSGNRIEDTRAWLLTVLNHKWNDQLRKKYRQPVIGIGDGFDIMDDGDELLRVEMAEEAEQVRKEKYDFLFERHFAENK